MAKTIISYLNGFSFATITWLFIETKVKLKVPKLVCFKTATIIEVHLKCLYDFYSHYLCITSMFKKFWTNEEIQVYHLIIIFLMISNYEYYPKKFGFWYNKRSIYIYIYIYMRKILIEYFALSRWHDSSNHQISILFYESYTMIEISLLLIEILLQEKDRFYRLRLNNCHAK